MKNLATMESGGVSQACRDDSPLMLAWKAWQQSDDFANSKHWAMEAGKPRPPVPDGANAMDPGKLADGSLWNAFQVGFLAATERAADLHEQINPASDQERHDKSPGAGAMGAVIEYRDTIRRVG